MNLEITSPVFTGPALMKMGGQTCHAPRNDILLLVGIFIGGINE